MKKKWKVPVTLGGRGIFYVEAEDEDEAVDLAYDLTGGGVLEVLDQYVKNIAEPKLA